MTELPPLRDDDFAHPEEFATDEPGQATDINGSLLARDAKIAIVVSRFNDYITDHMTRAAVSTYQQLGGNADHLTVIHVPGAFELPVTALTCAQSGKYEAIICVGCVIRGDTAHYDHVCGQAAKGIREVGTATGVPCIFGVLTVETVEQALNRAGVKLGNQGQKSMLAALEMIDVLKQIKAS